MRQFSFFLPVFIFFTACQSPKKIDCSKLNWREEGQNAATSGLQKNSALTELIQNCKKSKPLVDKDAYNSGYKDGLRLFCKTEVGLRVGRSGKLYDNTCPSSQERSFLMGYINGRILYLKSQLNSGEGEYANAKDRFWRKEQEYLLIKSEDPEEAKMQRDFLEAYQEESNQLKKSLEAIKKELSYLKRKKEELNFN
jgi:transcriptional antiterminator Rof (Rho-off)